MDNYNEHVYKLRNIRTRIRECNDVLRNIGEQVLGHDPVKATSDGDKAIDPVGLLSETNSQVAEINTELDKTQQMLNTFHCLFFEQEKAVALREEDLKATLLDMSGSRQAGTIAAQRGIDPDRKV